MKVEEFRIGNLALHEGEIKEVNEIGTKEVNEGVCGYLGFKSTRTMSWLEHKGSYLVNPIPLTEEWLVKFGFEETEKRTWEISQIGYDIDFCVHVDDGKVTVILWQSDPVYIKNIKHVHQLQNLYFALTGKELTIKN